MAYVPMMVRSDGQGLGICVLGCTWCVGWGRMIPTLIRSGIRAMDCASAMILKYCLVFAAYKCPKSGEILIFGDSHMSFVNKA
jgi:hypothetical protein